MINLLFAGLIAVNTPTAKVLPPPKVVQKVATMAAKLSDWAAYKFEGPISNIGASSIVVNGVTVNISKKTVLLRRFDGKSTLPEFSVNDQVQVYGKYTDDKKTAIDARVIRNLSIQKRHGTFVGTVQSVSATGFVLVPEKRPTQTVTVGSRTRYLNRKNLPISLSSIVTGHKVMVNGLWDNKLNIITEVGLVKDFSLPATPSGQKQTNKE